ncbi:hypothetical protein EDB19DRAFT_534547 [Suillus lakei]|nr:hypothetical protein EDB19DRAFT_534547 [Suillus lakei]
MTALVLDPIESSTITSAADFEPEEKRKSGLKVDIENNLRFMVNEAKQNLSNTLAKAPVSAVNRERLAEEHVTPMKSVRNIAEERFRTALECESQVKAAQSSSSLQLPADTSHSHTSGLTPEHATCPPQEPSEVKHDSGYFSCLADRERDHVSRDTDKGRAGYVSSPLGSSTLDITDRSFERPKYSPIFELGDMLRSARSATDAQDRGSLLRTASFSSRPVPPESWLPSTPEEDVLMPHTFIARRGSATSTYILLGTISAQHPVFY